MDKYVCSQVLAVISTVVIGVSYLAKDKKNIMLLCVVYCFFYSGHYLLLNAYTGTLMTLISAARNVWFYFNAKKNRNNPKFSLMLFLLMAIIFGIISYQDTFSIISIIASLLSTYSIWQKNVKLYRILAVPVSVCFIIYAAHINSFLSILTECILLVIEIVGIIQYSSKTKKVVNRIMLEEKQYD